MPQRIVGHKSIDTTRGYLPPDTRHLGSAAEQANTFLDAQESVGALPGLRRDAALTAPLISVESVERGVGVLAVSRRLATAPHEPSDGNDEAQVRKMLSPGLFGRADRV